MVKFFTSILCPYHICISAKIHEAGKEKHMRKEIIETVEGNFLRTISFVCLFSPWSFNIYICVIHNFIAKSYELLLLSWLLDGAIRQKVVGYELAYIVPCCFSSCLNV